MQNQATMRKFLMTIAAMVLGIISCFLSGNDNNPVIHWQEKIIRVENKSGWKYSTQIAVAKWNQSRVGVSFVVSDKDPDVVIEDTKKFMGGCDNQGTIGCSKVGRSRLLFGPQKLQLLTKPKNLVDRGQMSSVVAHELGHTLGLRHPEESGRPQVGCVLMSPSENCRRRVELKMVVEKQNLTTQASYSASYSKGEKISFEKTYDLICGPSRGELTILRHWYGGPGPDRRSWDSRCSFKAKPHEQWALSK